jgi:hypothetical protein
MDKARMNTLTLGGKGASHQDIISVVKGGLLIVEWREAHSLEVPPVSLFSAHGDPHTAPLCQVHRFDNPAKPHTDTRTHHSAGWQARSRLQHSARIDGSVTITQPRRVMCLPVARNICSLSNSRGASELSGTSIIMAFPVPEDPWSNHESLWP